MFRFALPKRPRRWKHGTMLTLVILFTLLGFAPLRGGDVELQVPVRHARIRLPARAPAIVKMELPPGSYSVTPHSLGYFNSLNEFVYTAEEPRGLIYARSQDKVIVVELQAPGRAEEFLDDYIQRIRDAVANLNARKNELLLARQRFSKPSGRPKQLASIPLSLSSVDLAQGFSDWVARCEGEGAAMLPAAQAALTQSAGERNELKRLYYESQKADVALELRSYDLQMALARLPRPQFASVLGSGNRELVRSKALAALERRQRSLQARRAELVQQQQMDMQWLASAPPKLPELGAIASTVPVMVPASSSLEAPRDDSLRLSIQQSRLSLSNAELEYVDSALAEVATAIQYVDRGGILEDAELPRLTIAASDFSDLRVSELDGLTLVEGSALKPGPAGALLLELAQKFEKPGHAQPLKVNGGSGMIEVECFPRELAYGLLIVDRCRRVETQSEGRPDGEELADRLSSMVESPADYGAAGNDLGYLEFMRWYASLSADTAQKLVNGVEAAAKRVTSDRQ